MELDDVIKVVREWIGGDMKIWRQTTMLVENEQGELVISSTKLELLEHEKILDASVNVLELSTRVKSLLQARDICTVRDLVQKTTHDLVQISGFWRASLREVHRVLEDIGLKLAKSPIITLKFEDEDEDETER